MSDDRPEINNAIYNLLLPFEVVKSAGGTLDDQSFVVGFELGMIDAELRICAYMPNGIRANPGSRYVHTIGLKQLDMLAMSHKFRVLEGDQDSSGEWTWVDFKNAY